MDVKEQFMNKKLREIKEYVEKEFKKEIKKADMDNYKFTITDNNLKITNKQGIAIYETEDRHLMSILYVTVKDKDKEDNINAFFVYFSVKDEKGEVANRCMTVEKVFDVKRIIKDFFNGLI